jgi:hypothetical protein
VSLAYDVRGDAKTVVRAGWVFLRRIFAGFLVGQLPFNTFNAGPAYNDIGGPAPVLFSSTAFCHNRRSVLRARDSGAQLEPVRTPVFSNFGATDVTVTSISALPHSDHNLNVQQQLASRGPQIGISAQPAANCSAIAT